MSLFLNNTIIKSFRSSGNPLASEASAAEFENFGTLYKHCKEIHLPHVGRSIRLGTLSEYRHQENKAVKDEHEGTFQITLDFPVPTTVSIDALKQATLDTSPVVLGYNAGNIQSNVFSGNLTEACVHSSDNVTVSNRTESEITLNGNVTLHVEGADAYVLCLSTSKKSGSIILDPEYDSVWSIRSGAVQEFVKVISHSLHEKFFNGQYFADGSVGPFKGPGFQPPHSTKHMLTNVGSDVDYRDRNIPLSADITEDNIQEIYKCINRSALIKPKEFSHEQEVRIIFRPCLFEPQSNKRFLFPRHLKPILIPFEPVMKMVDVLSQ